MNFKSLEMIGFKSFVDETKLEFEPGITAIVGPNGCGKSNISDAIRWVLGEQSAKLLRGNRMDDFIFNGSEGRKPLNIAEVSLTIANLNGMVSSPELSAYEEITVTRRLFRSGESEYYINKTSCRLKDVVDLFLDTGISTRGFSIIEQGQVHRIINSKPEERRFIIEESAGVMKYKHRRNSAIQKLESSQQNLLRIGDIISELERQMNSLKRQANKAERYKKYRGEVKELSLKILSVELKKISDELNTAEIEYNNYKEKEVKASAMSSSLKNRIENLRTELTTDEKALAVLRHGEFELGSGIERDEERISLMKRQLEDMGKEDIRGEEEIAVLRKEIENLGSQYSEKRGEVEKYSAEVKELKRQYNEKESSLVNRNKEYTEKQAAVERVDTEMLRILSQISHRKNNLTSIETKLDFIQKRKERVLIERKEIEDNLKVLEKDFEDSSKNVSEVKEKLGVFEKEREDLTLQLFELREKLKLHEEGLSDIKEKLGTCNSLLNSFEELQQNFEGYEDGVKAVMKLKREEAINGVHGVLVSFIETSPEFETAIESVLGERLQGVIVETHSEGIKAVEYLKSQSAGRAQFIPLTLRNLGNGLNGLDGLNGLIGMAASFLKCNDKYRDVLECLLRDVIIVKDMESALNIWNSSEVPYTIVTLDGDIIDPGGSITGGRRKGNGEGLMQRKRQIGEIRTEIEILKSELESRSKKRDEIKFEIDTLEIKIKTIEISIKDEEFSLINGENRFSKIQDEIERLKKKADTIEFEIREFDIEIGEFTNEIIRAKKEMLSDEEQHNILVSQGNNLKDDMRTLRENLDALIDDANRLKLNMTSLSVKMEGIGNEISRIEKEKKDLNLRMDKREEERSERVERKKEIEGSIAVKEEEIYKLSLKRDEKKKEITVKEESSREKNELLRTVEEEVKGAERELDNLRETVNGLSLKKTELNLKTNHIENRALEEHNVKKEEILEVDETEINIDDINQRLEFLRSEIERFGDVNLTAIEEYKNVSERYNFLKTQQDDLIHSIKSLHQTIEKIDNTTKNMFLDTYKKVNENFKTIFRRLFGGGRAELILIDEGNLLETGVDIIAQPSGKMLQNISLLSAGEKAMTAIALLFAIFTVKPSPFCLLDEVDAPLDEANLFRFRDMLREMSANTQFIVITHNQKTMSFADTLYGITMEDDGISKIISVNLKERDAKAA